MFETYPKSTAHPSKSVGEQDSRDGWNGTKRVTYGNTTAKDTVYNGDRVNTKVCEGGSGGSGGNDYPKSRTKFGTEKYVGK